MQWPSTRRLAVYAGAASLPTPELETPVELLLDDATARLLTRTFRGRDLVTPQPQNRELSLLPEEVPSSQISISEIATTVPVDERVVDRVQTVYLRTLPAAPESHGPRLVLVFLSTFAATMVGVLGAWTLLAQRPVPPATRVEVVHIDRPVPVPVPVPVPAEAPPVLSLDRPPQPLPAPPKASAPRPRPAAAAHPTPERVEVAVARPAPAPAPAPAAAPSVPEAARELTGTYSGRGDGRSLAIGLRFLADGIVVATIRRALADQELTAEARGTYELRGDTARIVLMEQGVAEPVAYTGTVSKSGVEGRMSQSGRNLGKFSVQR
jgi:hypothetical protein